MGTISYIFALFQINLKSVISLRWAFFFRLSFMAVNNILVMVTWVVLFSKFETIRGWDIRYMAVMFGMTAASYGVWSIFGNGTRHMARMVDEGELDTLLLQPRPVLLSLAGSHSEATGFGEIISGVILCGLAGMLKLHLVPALFFLILMGTVFWFSLSVLIGSTAFWFKDMNETSREMLMSAVFFATNPNSVYSGILKFVIFTAVPVAYLSFLPVKFIMELDWLALAGALAGTTALLGLSLLLFNAGLKRYESGNRFGVRG